MHCLTEDELQKKFEEMLAQLQRKNTEPMCDEDDADVGSGRRPILGSGKPIWEIKMDFIERNLKEFYTGRDAMNVINENRCPFLNEKCLEEFMQLPFNSAFYKKKPTVNRCAVGDGEGRKLVLDWEQSKKSLLFPTFFNGDYENKVSWECKLKLSKAGHDTMADMVKNNFQTMMRLLIVY
jgi:hypothetical protein